MDKKMAMLDKIYQEARHENYEDSIDGELMSCYVLSADLFDELEELLIKLGREERDESQLRAYETMEGDE